MCVIAAYFYSTLTRLESLPSTTVWAAKRAPRATKGNQGHRFMSETFRS